MLTERAVATWNSGPEINGVEIEYPDPVGSPERRTLKPDAEVLPMFDKIMGQAIKRWLNPEVHVVTELSSGLDSGVVASVCSGIHSAAIQTRGILVPGEDGIHQQARRKEMIDLFGYVDHYVEAEDFPPLTKDGVRCRENLFIPWEECYYEAMDQLFLNNIQPGESIVLTGVGGDELFFPHWDELNADEKESLLKEISREDLNIPDFIHPAVVDSYFTTQNTIEKAPRSLVPTSSKEAAAYGGARYLRKGIWPVDPFCTPEIIHFCRALPTQWRDDRALEKKLLASKGCSEAVTNPTSPETFSEFMFNSLRGPSRQMILHTMEESILHEHGVIDADAYRSAFAKYCAGDEMNNADIHFYAAAIMEMALKCAASRN